MPPKTQRVVRSGAPSSQLPSSNNVALSASLDPVLHPDRMSVDSLLDKALEINRDPTVQQLLLALKDKIPGEFSAFLEREKRERSVVISGIDDEPMEARPSDRQKHLEEKINKVFDAINVECRPSEIYRMGKIDPRRPRLVKVVFPSQAHWRTALANARLLKESGFPNVYIRRSMTAEERQREYELRQTARERNRDKGFKEWVVYKGNLIRASEIPHKHSENL